MKGKQVKGPLTEIASHLRQKSFDMEELVADNIGLEELSEEDLKQFPNLQALFIPRNKLKVLNHLEKNFRITFLDARDNQISDINLPKQEFIRELYLSGNLLHDFEKILTKMSHMKDLETLDLRGNPMTLEKGYRQSVIAQFQYLKILDGIEVVRPKKKTDPLSTQKYSRSISKSNQKISESPSITKTPISTPTPVEDEIDKNKNDSITPIKNARLLNTPAISKSASPKGKSSVNEESISNASSSVSTTEANPENDTDIKENKSSPQSTPTKTINETQLSKTTDSRKKRPKTVLQCLLSRPLSSADAIVKMKSDQIRLKQIQKQKKIEEEQTAVARKRKEEYERKAKCPPPLPDALLELEKKSATQNTEKKQIQKRASTRMFIKKPIIQELEEVPYELEFAVKLNPKLPNIFNKRMTYAAVFPTE